LSTAWWRFRRWHCNLNRSFARPGMRQVPVIAAAVLLGDAAAHLPADLDGARPSASAIARTPSPWRRSPAIRRRSSSDRYRDDRTLSASRAGGSPPFPGRHR
jgi:hypothetical protein